MKKDQYFNLEVNLLNDDNIAGMMLELGAANALGVYVMLLLHLRTKDNYEASCRPLPLKALAKRYDVDVDLIGRILREFDLFEVDEERQMFRAPYLDRVMKTLEEKWRINAENGKKGGRPRKTKKRAETPAGKGGKPNETQEKRGEENKSIVPVVNNSSNTAGEVPGDAAVAAATSGKVAAEGKKVAAERCKASVEGRKAVAASKKGCWRDEDCFGGRSRRDSVAASTSVGEVGGSACRFPVVHGVGRSALGTGSCFSSISSRLSNFSNSIFCSTEKEVNCCFLRMSDVIFPTMSHRGLLPAGCCVKRYCRYFRRREAQPTIVLKLFQTVGGCTWDTLSRTMHRCVRMQPQCGTMCGRSGDINPGCQRT